MPSLVIKLRAFLAHADITMRAAAADAVKAAAALAVVVPSLSAVLAGLHVPAADVAILASVSAAATAVASWLVRNHLAPAATTAPPAPAAKKPPAK